MDIRIEKTKHAIINAFLELRSQKPLEKIRIKELCEMAKINKSTFYSHYHDLYDLSEQLENEVVLSVFHSLSCPDELIEHPDIIAKEIIMGYLSTDALCQILFSGSRSDELIKKLECHIKDRVFSAHPEFQDDPFKNTIITYTIYGTYYAFRNNRQHGEHDVVETVNHLSQECLKYLSI